MDGEGMLVLVNRQGALKRVLLGAGGIAALVLPAWDFGGALLVPSVFTVFLWIITLGAATVGLPFLAAAILADSIELHVVERPDGETRIELHRANLLRRSSARLGPADIRGVEVREHDWESRPRSWSVSVRLASGAPADVGEFEALASAERLADRLRRAFGTR